MKRKLALMPVVIMSASAFAVMLPHKSETPSGLRDAVTDEIGGESRTPGAPAFPLPKAVKAYYGAADKNRPDASTPSKQIPGPMAAKEWTVMVFMNAKNSLGQSQYLGFSGDWDAADISEMKKVGTTDKVNIVIEHGRNKGSRRMLLGKNSAFYSGETVYGRYPNADMGDYKRVIEFAKWARTSFPARKYMLILWNHGSGWIDPIRNADASKGILFDDKTDNYVRTRQLGEILRQTGYMDVLALHACQMQMAEVAYEVKDNTGLIVASEENMVAQGFDYEKLLNFLNANTGANNEQLSSFFINWFRDFYAEGVSLGPFPVSLANDTGTLSTLRSSALKDLPGYLNAFADAMIRNQEAHAAKIAIANAIRFYSRVPNDPQKILAPYVDLHSFASHVSLNASNNETRQAAENLISFIRSRLVIRSLGINHDRVNGHDYSMVGGIAINMTMKTKSPLRTLADFSETEYSELALSRASHWDEFVAWADAMWRR